MCVNGQPEGGDQEYESAEISSGTDSAYQRAVVITTGHDRFTVRVKARYPGPVVFARIHLIGEFLRGKAQSVAEPFVFDPTVRKKRFLPDFNPPVGRSGGIPYVALIPSSGDHRESALHIGRERVNQIHDCQQDNRRYAPQACNQERGNAAAVGQADKID